MMISRQNLGQFGILMLLMVSFFAIPNQTMAQHGHGMVSPVGASAPGLLQTAYMSTDQVNWGQSQTTSHGNAVQHATYYSPVPAGAPPTSRYLNAEQMVNSRVPRGNDIMATDQHTLLQYRRIYRNGSTPQPQELVGQWNGVNKGIVEVAGYGQFIKDIQVGVNGQLHGDNVQVSQVKPGQLRLDGWQPKFDYQTGDYERRGSFAVQAPNGRGFFGHGVTFSYADGNNLHSDPARLLEDQVVKVDGNHMIGRAVAKFGPVKIPLAYFVLEKRQ